MIFTKAVTVEIDGKKILNSISYQFNKGHIYGIIGPNGAGKTTYLKVLSGFLKPAEGMVYFQDKPVTKPQRNIAVVWQKPYLLQTSVYLNVAYGLKVRDMSKNKIDKHVSEILDLFQISHLAKQKAASISGGESAKVAIARAVITSPDLLILDEPTASLDPQSVLDIEEIIMNLKEKYNMTILFVTHNMFQAKRIADVTLFFYRGQLIEGQPTDQLFSTPLNELTRNFISEESFY